MSIGKVFAVLCFAAFVSSCEVGTTQTPDHLLGTWKTSASGYADEIMRFTKDTIVFGNENGESRGYSIHKVVEQHEPSGVLYLFTYRDAGKTNYHLAFYYGSEGGGTITFKNQRGLAWTRTG